MYHFIKYLDARRLWLFSFNDACLWFKESVSAIKRGLAQHVKDGLIVRITRGLYANAMPSSRPAYAGEALVPYLRPLEINYESMESRLSSMGVISQIATCLTISTSGRGAWFATPIGNIEFTGFKTFPANLPQHLTWDDTRQIWMASPELAYAELCRAKRNIHLVDLEELKEASSDYASA